MITEVDTQPFPKVGERFYGIGITTGFKCSCGHTNEYSAATYSRWDTCMPMWCRKCKKKYVFFKGVVNTVDNVRK